MSGVALDVMNGKTTSPAGAGGTTDSSYTKTSLVTASFAQPWNIFTSNVAAIYYF